MTHPTILALAACLAFGSLAAVRGEAAPTRVYSYTVKDINGKDVPLSSYKGKVLLIVNTASLCGNTPQYAGLEKIYEKYKDKGLRILAFPANDFGQQEPGSNTQIHEFCTGKYNVSFDLFSKISVKQPDQAPLYTFLTDKTTDPKFGGDIEWNFAKFLVSRKGEVINRFQASHKPEEQDVTDAIEAALAEK